MAVNVIDIRFQRLKIQSSKLRGVIKISAQGLLLPVLAQRRQIEAGRPPGLSAFGVLRAIDSNTGRTTSGCQCHMREHCFR